MKKVLFLISLIISISAMAQDTTTLNSPCYMNDFLPNNTSLLPGSFVYFIHYYIPFQATQPTPIYGIATVGHTCDDDPLFFYLLDSTLEVLDSVHISTRDVKCHVDMYPMHDYHGSVKECRELYFDKPNIVTGNFYIVDRYFRIPDHPTFFLYCDNYPDSIPNPVVVANDNGYFDTMYHNWISTFPIVQPDRIMPCPPVTGLRVTRQGNYNVALAWDNIGDSVVYQLLFDGDTIQTTDTTVSRYALAVDSSQHYMATVRYACPHRANCQYHPDPIYSDWSDTLDIFLYGPGPGTTPTDSTDTVSIYAPGAIEGCVSVLPDPVHNHAEVLSSFGVSRVEVYSAAGLKAMDVKAEGFKATLDVSKLPSGTYLLRIHTQQGVVTKKLVKK